jgi:type II secretion system protein J
MKHPHTKRKVKGFTLIELIIASTIGVFVALVAVSSLKLISAGAEIVDNNIDIAGEVRFVAKSIGTDLSNLYRDKDTRNMKFVTTTKQVDGAAVNFLTFYTVGRTPARPAQPEGDVYEVEYYLMKNEQKSSLMRRLWPNPQRDTQPGGVITEIASGIDVFAVSFFDGQKWLNEWSEEEKTLPQLVEIIIAAKAPDSTREFSGDRVSESLVMNFSRFMGTESSALQDDEQEEQDQQEQNQATE